MNGISLSGGSLNVLQSAITAVNQAAAGISRSAQAAVAASVSDSGEILSALIDSRQQVLYTQAAAKLLDTADQMMGTMIDINV